DTAQPDIWSAWAHTTDGTRPIMLVDDVRLPGRDRHLWVRSGQDQSLEIIDAIGLVEITGITTGTDDAGPYVGFSGVLHGAVDDCELILQGTQSRVSVCVSQNADGTFNGSASLMQSRWAGPTLPVPHGGYTLRG